MKGRLLAAAAVFAVCGCGSAEAPDNPRVPTFPSDPPAVGAPDALPQGTYSWPAPTVRSQPVTTRSTPKPTSTRPAPKTGAECRDGDELRYPVCAGHRAWVDGQLALACLGSGGLWNAVTRVCTPRPAVTTRPAITQTTVSAVSTVD
ncbi:hypothetical protein EV193_101284 [Herbihabitans rhizosphaerae]|uniref:Chitin-binding type-2 domain-containing protein n=1 Tax=Herbihabitans rhizosphaerae TaxID=1872711 RepID=A0A4Q7L465_9PSEU|nr:hypothetical protein [Herbihabitans rhizosphaerae]RZS44408.1 hypothetical protein EV193_101284 [Herbihabitans rhizosphaerae]